MSALQQLLNKIGSGIDEAGFVSLMSGTGMGGSKARFKEIVNRMVAAESDAHLLTALEDLSTSLSMANEVFSCTKHCPKNRTNLSQHDSNSVCSARERI